MKVTQLPPYSGIECTDCHSTARVVVETTAPEGDVIKTHLCAKHYAEHSRNNAPGAPVSDVSAMAYRRATQGY